MICLWTYNAFKLKMCFARVPKVSYHQFEIMVGKQTCKVNKRVAINKLKMLVGTIPKNVPTFIPKIVPKQFWDDF